MFKIGRSGRSTVCCPITTRFGVYFLHGWCSCLHPFSENVRFGVPVFFLLGVPVVLRWSPGGVMVSRCCRVVSRSCRGGVLVVFRWCPSDVPVVFLWCLGSVSGSQCWSGRVRCAGGVPVVSWSCPGGVPVVLQYVQWCPGSVPVVGVPLAVVSRAVVCLGAVTVLF